MDRIQIFTIGFTHKSAEEFFTKLSDAGVTRVVDVRLNNTSQLAGFSKKDDLRYFLWNLLGVDYVHIPELAPTRQILDGFKKQGGLWSVYEHDFLALMQERRIEETVSKKVIHQGCLLCSEHQPEHCHRRLVAEYLENDWGNVDTIHLT